MRGAPWRAYQRSTAKIAIASHDERDRDAHRVEQVGLDLALEGEADEGRGQERHREVGREALLHRVAPDAGEGPGEPGPVLPAHGEDGAELDHDVEDLALLVVHAEEVGDDDEVAGGGDREEFREAFHHAQDERVQERGDFHRRESSTAARPLRARGARARMPPQALE